jgi:hypothetical protein
MNLNHSILTDFSTEWGLCLGRSSPAGVKILDRVLLLTTCIFIDIVAIDLQPACFHQNRGMSHFRHATILMKTNWL